jgi:hypothetical protein
MPTLTPSPASRYTHQGTYQLEAKLTRIERRMMRSGGTRADEADRRTILEELARREAAKK